MVHEMSVAELQRTLFDVALGIQTTQGYVTERQLYDAIGRYGFDQNCGFCVYNAKEAERALEERGNLQRDDECYPGYLYVR